MEDKTTGLETSANQTPPTIHFIETGVTIPTWSKRIQYSIYQQWSLLLRYLLKEKERLNLIQRHVCQDIDNGHLVLCYAAQLAFVQQLYQRLRRDRYSVAYVDGKVGTSRRTEICRKFRDGRYQVICTSTALAAQLVANLPNIGCIHNLTPMCKLGPLAARTGVVSEHLTIKYYVDSGTLLAGAYCSQLYRARAKGWGVEMVPSVLSVNPVL